MTKGQLEEQRMNEKAGYPSNLEEADRTKDLENRVAGIETGISQILGHLQNGGPSSPEPSQLPGPYNEPVDPARRPNRTQPLSPPSTDSNGSPVPESQPTQLRTVTLPSGKTIAIPPVRNMKLNPMNLGPASPPTGAPDGEGCMGDWDEPLAVVPEQVLPEPVVDPKMERVCILVEQVSRFLQTKDVHRVWRRWFGRSVHRNAGYDGWSGALKTEFDALFQSYLNDAQFVTSVCRKVIDMDNGPAIGSEHVATLVVAAAGFTAFTLSGLEG